MAGWKIKPYRVPFTHPAYHDRSLSTLSLAGTLNSTQLVAKKRQHSQGQAAGRCGSKQFIQKENFPEFTYRLVILWNRVIYTKLLTHPYKEVILIKQLILSFLI